MNSRERVIKSVNHMQTDRVPGFIARIDDLDYYTSSLQVGTEEELNKLLGLDLRKTNFSGVLKTEKGKNIWGAKDFWDAGYSSERGGFPLENAETVKDVEKHNFPTENSVDYEEFAKRVDSIDPEYPIGLYLGTLPPFCTIMDLFGMQNAMILMYESPEVIEAALERIEAFVQVVIKNIAGRHAGRAEFFCIGDDFATQRGMMISPELWRKFLKPIYRRIFASIKSYNLKVWFHSCGTFREVFPDLIDCGMDIWETVQAHLDGNDPVELKREFGDYITFFGAINCQHTLPFGTPDDVRKEVRERVKVLGKNGGYICGPDHSIQKNIPVENLYALFDELKKINS